MQNLKLPSFFGTSTIGLDLGLVDGLITPFFSILSTISELVELKIEVQFPTVLLMSVLASADEISSFTALQCQLVGSAS